MTGKTRITALFALALLAGPAMADEWRMLEESALRFEASWEGTALPGRFDTFDVRLVTGADELTDSQLTVTVDLAGADMEDPDINEAIAGDEWFAVSEYPRATYVSDAIVKTAPGEYRASGQLELKGVSLPVDVPFRWTETDSRAEMSGELIVDRLRFNVGSGEWANDDSIGADVLLSFNVLLVRK